MTEILSAGSLVTISFVLFWVLIFTKGRTAVSGALNARVNEIRERIATGEKLREDAMGAVSRAEQELRDARADAETILADAKATAKDATAKARTRANDFITAQERGVADRITSLRTNAGLEIRDQIVDTAITTSATVLKQKYTKDTKLVEKSIKELSF